MYELDREKIGKFIAELRKEKGMTQKELAEKLKVSDKSVSKWETGNGIPDVSMLMPIADLFEVTVAEVLKGQRLAQTDRINVTDVNAMLKQTLQMSEEENKAFEIRKKKAIRNYVLCLVIAALEVGLLLMWNGSGENMGISMMTFVLLAVFFGGYFVFFIKEKLPAFYDENSIGFYTDGFMKLHIPGVRFNNNNWPYIVATVRKSMNILMVGYPLFWIVVMFVWPDATFLSKQILDMVIGFTFGMGAIFVPIYTAARKYK